AVDRRLGEHHAVDAEGCVQVHEIGEGRIRRIVAAARRQRIALREHVDVGIDGPFRQGDLRLARIAIRRQAIADVLRLLSHGASFRWDLLARPSLYGAEAKSGIARSTGNPDPTANFDTQTHRTVASHVAPRGPATRTPPDPAPCP